MQTAHFSQHVHDVAGSLHDLLLNLLRIEDLHAHRDVFNTLIRTGRGHGDVLLDGRATIQFNDDRLLLIRLDIDRCRRWRESFLDDNDVNMSGRQRHHYDALRVGLVCRSIDYYFRIPDRTSLTSYLDSHGRDLSERDRGM
jgi:hypothetical protein